MRAIGEMVVERAECVGGVSVTVTSVPVDGDRMYRVAVGSLTRVFRTASAALAYYAASVARIDATRDAKPSAVAEDAAKLLADLVRAATRYVAALRGGTGNAREHAELIDSVEALDALVTVGPMLRNHGACSTHGNRSSAACCNCCCAPAPDFGCGCDCHADRPESTARAVARDNLRALPCAQCGASREAGVHGGQSQVPPAEGHAYVADLEL